MLNFIKEYFKRAVKKMAQENEKSFGNGKLDCCGLNKPNNTAKKPNNQSK